MIDPEDLKKLKADAEYWVEHMNPVNYVNVALEEELGKEHFDLLFDHAMILEGRAVRENPDRGLFQGNGAFGGGVVQPSGDVLRLGFNHVIGLAKAEMEKMKAEGFGEMRASTNALRKWYLLKSIVIMFEAVITFAKRHAALARETGRARRPTRSARPNSSRSPTCASACPAEPPRDFWEAVQSVRFMHLAAWKESSDRAEVPVGRIDQFWYPYYKADIESGKITRAQAAELIGAMWLKIREVENLVTIKREHRAAPGSQLPNVTLCGRDKDGNDLTNELSWMVLEVMAQIHLSEPAVYVRYHEDQDEDFIVHALKCNREFGGGNPAFLNDELGTRRYLDRGVPIEDACNWNASGCLGYHLECCRAHGRRLQPGADQGHGGHPARRLRPAHRQADRPAHGRSEELHLHRAALRSLPQAGGLLRRQDARALLHLVDHRDRQQPHERAARRHALPRLHPRRSRLARGRLPLSRGQGLLGGRQGHLRLRRLHGRHPVPGLRREEGHHGPVARGHGRQLGRPRGHPPDVPEGSQVRQRRRLRRRLVCPRCRETRRGSCRAVPTPSPARSPCCSRAPLPVT